MDVAVRDLLGGRGAHVEDLDVERQRLPGERMVRIEDDLVPLDRDDDEGQRSVRGVCLEARRRARSRPVRETGALGPRPPAGSRSP
jgi:hypothetical protein